MSILSNLSHVSLALFLVWSVSSVNLAFADERQIYSSNICHARYGSQVDHLDHLPTGIVNRTKSSIWITCPLIKDNASRTGLSQAWVNVDQQTYCQVESRRDDGLLVGIALDWKGPGWVNLGSIRSSDTNGYYVLACYLPAYGTLRNIDISER